MKQTAAQKSARNEECTLNVAGVCSYDPSKVMLCHIGFGGDGTAKRRWPYESNGIYGCDPCHKAIDGNKLSRGDHWFYIARGIARTNERRKQKGV